MIADQEVLHRIVQANPTETDDVSSEQLEALDQLVRGRMQHDSEPLPLVTESARRGWWVRPATAFAAAAIIVTVAVGVVVLGPTNTNEQPAGGSTPTTTPSPEPTTSTTVTQTITTVTPTTTAAAIDRIALLESLTWTMTELPNGDGAMFESVIPRNASKVLEGEILLRARDLHSEATRLWSSTDGETWVQIMPADDRWTEALLLIPEIPAAAWPDDLALPDDPVGIDSCMGTWSEERLLDTPDGFVAVCDVGDWTPLKVRFWRLADDGTWNEFESEPGLYAGWATAEGEGNFGTVLDLGGVFVANGTNKGYFASTDAVSWTRIRVADDVFPTATRTTTVFTAFDKLFVTGMLQPRLSSGSVGDYQAVIWSADLPPELLEAKP